MKGFSYWHYSWGRICNSCGPSQEILPKFISFSKTVIKLYLFSFSVTSNNNVKFWVRTRLKVQHYYLHCKILLYNNINQLSKWQRLWLWTSTLFPKNTFLLQYLPICLGGNMHNLWDLSGLSFPRNTMIHTFNGRNNNYMAFGQILLLK